MKLFFFPSKLLRECFSYQRDPRKNLFTTYFFFENVPNFDFFFNIF
jgi:hypothetical protein